MNRRTSWVETWKDRRSATDTIDYFMSLSAFTRYTVLLVCTLNTHLHVVAELAFQFVNHCNIVEIKIKGTSLGLSTITSEKELRCYNLMLWLIANLTNCEWLNFNSRKFQNHPKTVKIRLKINRVVLLFPILSWVKCLVIRELPVPEARNYCYCHCVIICCIINAFAQTNTLSYLLNWTPKCHQIPVHPPVVLGS